MKSLMGNMDGTVKRPAQFKLGDNGVATTEVNPAYEDWRQKDQLVLSWINNSFTPSVLSTVARSKSSQETWVSLEKRYASQSHNRIMHLRNELFNTKGEGLSVTDFVDKVTHIADNLALAGKPVDDDDLVSITMNNIGLAFEATVSSTQARDTLISYDDLVALLLGAELRRSHTLLQPLMLPQQHCMLLHNLCPQVKAITTEVTEPPSMGVGVGSPIPHHHRLPYLQKLRAWSCVRFAIVLDTRH